MNEIQNEVQIGLSPELVFSQIASLKKEMQEREAKIKELEIKLEYERELREKSDTNSEIIEPPKKKTTKQREVTLETNTYSEIKINGVRKARMADSIRSYSDFKAIQDYFLNKGEVRNWAIWTIGVSLGLRVSDLFSLRFKNVIEDDMKTVRKYIKIYEKKTGKLNNLLITEAAKKALQYYLYHLNYHFKLEDFLFKSEKTGGKLDGKSGWRILSNAGKALKLPLNIGSHTMRRSFANIAACIDKHCIDMNTITKVQGLLNHSDQRVTMKYLGTFQKMYDEARIAVSDFVLGKTQVDELLAGTQYSANDIIERLEILESLLSRGERLG